MSGVNGQSVGAVRWGPGLRIGIGDGGLWMDVSPENQSGGVGIHIISNCKISILYSWDISC